MLSSKLYFLLSAILGSFILVLFSMVQKIVILGEILFSPRAYIVPVTFGALTGGIIGYLLFKTHRSNKDLYEKNNQLLLKNAELKTLYNKLLNNQRQISTIHRQYRAIANPLKKISDIINHADQYSNTSPQEWLEIFYDISTSIFDDYLVSFAFSINDDSLKLIKSNNFSMHPNSYNATDIHKIKSLLNTTDIYEVNLKSLFPTSNLSTGKNHELDVIIFMLFHNTIDLYSGIILKSPYTNPNSKKISEDISMLISIQKILQWISKK